MSTGLGQLSEFHRGQDHLSVYLKCFKMYVQSNGVKAEKKVPLFLTIICPGIYGVLHNLFAFRQPDNQGIQQTH